jgi:hypothetical protein
MNYEIAPKEYFLLADEIETMKYLHQLTIDGKSDWRLPNSTEQKELLTMLKDDLPSIVMWVKPQSYSMRRTRGYSKKDEPVASVVPVRSIKETLKLAPKEYHKFQMTLEEARMYCFSLMVDGEVGWRLPTRAERLYLENRKKSETRSVYYGIACDDNVSPYHCVIPVKSTTDVVNKPKKSTRVNALKDKAANKRKPKFHLMDKAKRYHSNCKALRDQ